MPGGFLFLLGLVMIAPALVRPFALAFGKVLAVFYARRGIADLAQGNLTRQPSRVAVTASTSMIALAIIVAMGGMVSSLTVTLYDLIRENLGSDYLFVPPSIALWSSNVGAKSDFADQLKAVDGVEAGGEGDGGVEEDAAAELRPREPFLEDVEDREELLAHIADTDILVASAKAYLAALNKLHSKTERVAAQG